MIPSWIMKFYILDLSPHNSMARYLVGGEHDCACIATANASDARLTMDDYLHMGVMDALEVIGQQSGKGVPVHAMGYCLGSTLLTIAAAAMARTRWCGRHAGTC